MWFQGMYFLNALEVVFSHFGAGLSGKKSNAKYLENPLTKNIKEELTEEEIQTQREQFIASLEIMKSNFDSHKKGEKGS